MDERTSQPSGSTEAIEPTATSLSMSLQQSKEQVSALKNHIAFAHQCLSLLQNQLSHAADTLGILQDQVVKVQETVDQLVVPTVVHQSPLHAQECNMNMASHFQHSQGSTACVVSPVTGPATALVENGKGQKVGGGVGHTLTEGERMHAACHVSPGTARPVAVPCLCSVCIEAHAGAIDAASHHKAHDNTAASSGCQDQLPAEVHITSAYPHTVSNSSSETRPCGPTPGGVLVKIEPQTSPVREPVDIQDLSQGQSCRTSCASHSREPAKIESSSPMAHQLLQVIDVLQGVDDEVKDGIKAMASLMPSIPQSAPQGCSPGMSQVESFTDPLLTDSRLHHTMSPGFSSYSRQRSSPRRNRKQSLLFKHQASSATPGNAVMTVMTDDFHSLDLMKVPQPVLASTLPPEFLVVPATSYDQDSASPITASPTKQAKGSGSSISDDGAVAITPFMTITTGITTVGLQSSSDCDVGKCDQDRGESVVTHSTGKVSADPSYSGHNLVSIDLCARDVTSNVSLTRPPSSVSSSSGSAMTASGGLLNAVSSSVNSPKNGLQLVTTSKRQSSCTETATTSSMGQQTALGRQALEVGEFLSSIPMSSLGSSAPKTRARGTGAKKPIILRRSSREQTLPEGVVVLVPTIADAKRLIASTGGNSRPGNTPVLIPQQMLNDIQSDTGRLCEGGSVTSPTKRHFDSVSSFTANDSPAKRLAT